MSITPHVCQVCRTVLDWFVPYDGSAPSWQHSRSNTPADGHAARPVPQMETTIVVGRCDFCGLTDPMWSYAVVESPALDAGPLGAVMDADHAWAACQPCAELIDANELRRLVVRVRRHLPVEVRRDPLSGVAIYARYVAMFSGPFIKTEL